MIKLLFVKLFSNLRALFKKVGPIWRRRIVELVILVGLFLLGLSFITRWANFEIGKAQFNDGDFIQAQYNFSKEQFPFPLDLWRQYFDKGTALLVADSQDEARAAFQEAKDSLDGADNAVAECMIETNLAISYEKTALSLRQKITTVSDPTSQAAGYRLIAQTYTNVMLAKNGVKTYCDMSDADTFKRASDEADNAKAQYEAYIQKAFDIDGTGFDPEVVNSDNSGFDPNALWGLEDLDSRQQQLVTQSEAGNVEFMQAQDEADQEASKVYQKW